MRVILTCLKCGCDYERVSSSRHKYCAACYDGAIKASQQKLKTNRDWVKAHPERVRELSLRYHYGITSQQLDEMAAVQNGRCAICGASPRATSKQNMRLHIDHDHKTKRVRGLLCFHCNRGLGSFGDNVDVLRSAIAYLKKGGRNAD
jgi:hypothetical protein